MNKSFELESIDGELLVTYTITDLPLRVEECHGMHYFDDSTLEIDSVELVIDGNSVDITKIISEEQIEIIKKQLD